MKTTTFSAFKAIATVALICIIGITKSKAQNGPASGDPYSLDNQTACTLVVEVYEDDNGSCVLCGPPTTYVLPPTSTTPITITQCPLGNVLCDLKVRLVMINGSVFPPISVAFSNQFASCTSCGACPVTMNWGLASTVFN